VPGTSAWGWSTTTRGEQAGIEILGHLCVYPAIDQPKLALAAGTMDMIMLETTWVRYSVVGLALGLGLAGCTAIEKHDASQTEQLLAAAGFQMRPADTPAKLADLERQRQRKLVSQDRNGEMTYLYADAVDCKCLYSGDQENYDRFQKLQVQQNDAQQEMMAAELNQQAAMNWEMWGPW
jgi:hypothetical protein